jgi:hypothetical protein
MSSVDEEWCKFLQSHKQTLITQPTNTLNKINTNDKAPICIDKETKSILEIPHVEIQEESTLIEDSDNKGVICEDLYISTKTKVLFLNQEIDIQKIFWNIPIIEYWKPQEGVVKKQMKIVSKNVEEYNQYREKLQHQYYYKENIIKQIDNPTARVIKFKDERKITIGISKKDILNFRSKVKNAFYNCFAIVIRFKQEGVFKEVHVKVFNTGKMEIPGVLNLELLERTKTMVLQMLQPIINKPINYLKSDQDINVLINSNFNCGYFINRDKLYVLLCKKYGIDTSYDPCTYPGIKCKYYYNNEQDDENQGGKIENVDHSLKVSEMDDNKKYTEVSFMIFRTGSCLIVGNCSEKILVFVYKFIRNILEEEYENVRVHNDEVYVKNKKIKIIKKTIQVSSDYYKTIVGKP